MGYRLRPYEVTAGDTDRALDAVQEDHLRRARAPDEHPGGALEVQAAPRGGEGRPHAGEAEGQHHRRVLGDDDRGRRQLPAAALPRERGRRGRHPARDARGSSTRSGRRARHEGAQRPCAAPTRRSTAWASSRAVGVGEDARGLRGGERVIRGLFQTFAHAVGLYGYHLPDMNEIAEISPRVLQQRPPRRRRPHGSRQAHHERHAVEGAHDAQREAVRLHAERGRVGRRAVGDHREVPRARSSAPSRRAATGA